MHICVHVCVYAHTHARTCIAPWSSSGPKPVYMQIRICVFMSAHTHTHMYTARTQHQRVYAQRVNTVHARRRQASLLQVLGPHAQATPALQPHLHVVSYNINVHTNTHTHTHNTHTLTHTHTFMYTRTYTPASYSRPPASPPSGPPEHRTPPARRLCRCNRASSPASAPRHRRPPQMYRPRRALHFVQLSPWKVVMMEEVRRSHRMRHWVPQPAPKCRRPCRT